MIKLRKHNSKYEKKKAEIGYFDNYIESCTEKKYKGFYRKLILICGLLIAMEIWIVDKFFYFW